MSSCAAAQARLAARLFFLMSLSTAAATSGNASRMANLMAACLPTGSGLETLRLVAAHDFPGPLLPVELDG